MNDVIIVSMTPKKVKTAYIFENLLRTCNVCISYTPHDDEPNPILCPYIPRAQFFEYVPDNPHTSPIDYAHTLIKKYSSIIFATILIPGRAFDVTGTRHGRGYGWYDRFLSHVPRHWIRIGITSSNRFHREKILRKPHDEPVDFIIILHHEAWEIIKTDARVF